MESMKALIILSVLILFDVASAQETKTSKARISVPRVNGVLELDVGDTSWEAHVRADGKETQLQAMHRRDNLRITAFLQKVKFPAGPEKCRDKWWPMTAKSAPIKREDLHQYEKGDMAVVEYIIPEFRGTVLDQKSLHAYLGGDHLCAEVHLSKDHYRPEDQALIDGILSTARFLPNDAGVPIP